MARPHYCPLVPRNRVLSHSAVPAMFLRTKYFFLLSDTGLLTCKIYSDLSRIVIRINIWCPKCYHDNIGREDRDLYIASVLLQSYTSPVFLKIKQIRKMDRSRQYQNSFTWAGLLRESFRKWKQQTKYLHLGNDTVLQSVCNDGIRLSRKNFCFFTQISSIWNIWADYRGWCRKHQKAR